MSTDPLSPMADDEALIALAISQSRRLGMPREDAQDCAMELMQHLMSRLRQPLSVPLLWAHKVVYNYAISYKRRLARLRAREYSYHDPAIFSYAWISSYPSSGPEPFTFVLQRALWHQLQRCLNELTPLQCELFIRFHLFDQSIATIAIQCVRTPHAVEQRLSHARNRLTVLLHQAGWSEAEVRALFQRPPVIRSAYNTFHRE